MYHIFSYLYLVTYENKSYSWGSKFILDQTISSGPVKDMMTRYDTLWGLFLNFIRVCLLLQQILGFGVSNQILGFMGKISNSGFGGTIPNLGIWVVIKYSLCPQRDLDQQYCDGGLLTESF